MEETLEKFYYKGYRTLNKLYDKLNQKGFKISKSEVKKFIDSRYMCCGSISLCFYVFMLYGVKIIFYLKFESLEKFKKIG